jgi:hypothetical protein
VASCMSTPCFPRQCFNEGTSTKPELLLDVTSEQDCDRKEHQAVDNPNGHQPNDSFLENNYNVDDPASAQGES